MPKYTLPNHRQGLIKRAFIPISQAAKFLNISTDTLRNWEKEGKLNPLRTKGGARRYKLIELRQLKEEIGNFRHKNHSMLTVSKAAILLGVSKDTLRNWEKRDLVEVSRTKGGARRYSKSEISRIRQELDIKPIINSATNIESTQPKNKFGGWRFTSGLMLIMLLLMLLDGTLLFEISSKQAPEIKKEDVLGEKTQGLQTQVYQLATILESLQNNVKDLQVEKSDKEYIYLPSNLNTNQLKVGEVAILTGSDGPNSDFGNIGDYYLRKSSAGDLGIYLKTNSNWKQYNLSPSLQTAYETDNNLSILKGKDLKINLEAGSSILISGSDPGSSAVTIDSSGNIKAQTTLVAEFRVLANKISGHGTINKGEKTVEIENSLVDQNSRILITPTTETDLVLAVTEKKDHDKFTVSAPKVLEEDLNFDWWMVGEEEMH